MIGYSNQSKRYKVWGTESSKLIVTRDVTFAESSVNHPTAEISLEYGKPSIVAVPGEK